MVKSGWIFTRDIQGAPTRGLLGKYNGINWISAAINQIETFGRGLSHRNVVDQAHFADPGGGQKAQGAVERGHGV